MNVVDIITVTVAAETLATQIARADACHDRNTKSYNVRNLQQWAKHAYYHSTLSLSLNLERHAQDVQAIWTRFVNAETEQIENLSK